MLDAVRPGRWAGGLLMLIAVAQLGATVAFWCWWRSSPDGGYVALAAYGVSPMLMFGVMAGAGWAARRRLVHVASSATRTSTGTVQALVVAAFVLCTVATILVIVLVVPILLATSLVFEGIG